MYVLKFGGTSVASAKAMKQTCQIIKEKSQQQALMVVVSAMGGVTDLLLKLGQEASQGQESWRDTLAEIEKRHVQAAQELLPLTRQSSLLSAIKRSINEMEDIGQGVFVLRECTWRTRDHLASFGERLSSSIVQAVLREDGVQADWKDARELIRTDSQFGKAEVNWPETETRIRAFVLENKARVVVVPGFIASDTNGQTTTLGRGGSDYTGALLAAAVDAEILEIWTDVSGMMTADPRLVPSAKVIPAISYLEAMELSHFGAKVIYPPTIQPVQKKGIPVWIKNTFAPQDNGTLIQQEPMQDGAFICGITSIASIVLLTLEGAGMVGIPGFSRRLFEALSREKINVILITQASSEHSICVGIDAGRAEDARRAVNDMFSHEIGHGLVDPVSVEDQLSIVALVGERMRHHPGISGRMFNKLGRNGVNVRAIAQGSSERNISAVISAGDVRKAINVLHEEFFETTYKQLNLFVVGLGNVGSKLLSQLHQQKEQLQQKLRLTVRVVGIANSRKMWFQEEGISLDNWKETLDKQGQPMDLGTFVQDVTSRNLRNSLFVDVTANEVVARVYPQLLKESVSVVACNKVACSSELDYYLLLKQLAREFNAHFLFETNVGAGLPVIGTLNDLVNSGDKVRKIEAVLSGTLNYVFNHYDGSEPFAHIVKRAQDEGYTEPDPRLDLSGTDVARKILILARECGEDMSMSDIHNEGFLPDSCLSGTVDDFYIQLEKEEVVFQGLLQRAREAGGKLKFVATYEDGKASVGLQVIDPQHDFYHLYGKDNVVRFYTERYPEQPLVVKGAGAGAEVTASGLFADIMRARN